MHFHILGCKDKHSSFYSEVSHTHLYIILQCMQQKLLKFEKTKCQDPAFSPDSVTLNPYNAICIGGSVYTGTGIQEHHFQPLWTVKFTRACMDHKVQSKYQSCLN